MCITKGVRGFALSVSLLVTVTLTVGALAQPKTEAAGWEELKDEPSRGQLFRQYAETVASGQQGQPRPAAIPSSFHFPRDAIYDTNGTQRKDSIFGVDISHYESAVPLGDLKRQKVGFVYAKASQGTGSRDGTFKANWKTLGTLPDDQKIPRGAYHFLSSDPAMSGKDQADRFVDYVNESGGFQAGDLPPVLDLEWDKACDSCPDRWVTNQRSPEQIVSTAIDFLNRVKERTGRTPMIYTNKGFLRDEKITDPELLSRLTGAFKIWIFDLDGPDLNVELPNPNKNLAHVLWQFSFVGKLSSYPHTLDVNVFKGTPDAFKAALTAND